MWFGNYISRHNSDMEDLADSFPVVGGMLVVLINIYWAPSFEFVIWEGVSHCNALLGSLHQGNATLSLPSKSSVALYVISFLSACFSHGCLLSASIRLLRSSSVIRDMSNASSAVVWSSQKSSSTARLTLPPSVEAYQYRGHGALSHNDSYDC